MRTDDGQRRVRWALVVLGMATGLGADAPSKRAVSPITPEVPGPVVVAIQEGKYAEAASGLDKLIGDAKSPAERSYYRFLRGLSESLGGKVNEARQTLSGALAEDPKGPWASKIRFELAFVELAAGRPDAAEVLARLEAESLLSPDRKDRLAEVYHAFARRLLTPDDPVTAPDPVRAYALLSKARDLAKGEALRASLLFAMAEVGRRPGAAGQQPAPGMRIDRIIDLQAYLKEYPKGPDRDAARFQLGEAQLDLGQSVNARQVFSELARDIAAELARVPSKEKADRKARALYQVARTHGVPNPSDDTQLGLGIAALRRFLLDAPTHPLAVHASFEIGASYLSRGKADQAIEAFNAFLKGEGYKAETNEAERDQADLSMTATYQVAQTLQGQAKFEQAIAAYREYLAKFPNGPQSAEAQRAILQVRLEAATDALARKKYAEARAAWQAFVAENPLDGRVSELMFRVGESFQLEKKFDQAIEAWSILVGKYPATEQAAHAQFEVASIFEVEKGDPAGAIERFRKVGVEPWKSQAAQRVAVMEDKALTVVTPRTFRSGETAHLKVTTRNLEALTFTAYKLNAEAYFRKKHVLGDVESLDIGLVAPDVEWTAPVPGFGKFKPVEATYDLKVAVPGVYVVKVSDEKTLQATALVIGSDMESIVKISREQILVFAQDMKTGQGRKGARVLIADGSGVILEKTTGDDGVLLSQWDKPLPGGTLQYLVLDGGDAAGSALGVPDKVAQGLSPRAYIYTDRPAYKPGQEVALRGVAREAKDGQYANPASAVYQLQVRDSRGRTILAKSTKLSEFGTFHEALRLGDGAPIGTYQVSLAKPGEPAFAGQFEVRSYQLQKVDLKFDLPRMVYYRGEKVEADVVARYQYGAPVAGRPIEIALPDDRTVRGLTDASGKFHFELATEGFSEEQALQIVARLPADNVQAMAGIMLAVQGFRINLATPRDVYLDGETFALELTTLDALGKPIGEELRVAVLKQLNQDGRTTEREVSRHAVTTDKDTGKVRLQLKVEDDQGGTYILRAAGTDRFKNPIVADETLVVSGKDDETRLRILTDRTLFKVGETASVNLHSRSKAGTTLLAWEADRVIQYRLLPIQEGDNPLTWTVDGLQFPNFTLTASRMIGDGFERASLDVRVERELIVSVTPKKTAVGPGEEVEVEVSTVDQVGNPVAAEVALGLVDRSLLRLFADSRPSINAYFYDQTRTGAFATESTNTFRDEPETQPVSDAVVEEAERLLAQSKNDASRNAVRGELGRTLGVNAPAPGIEFDRDREPRFRMDAPVMPAPAAPPVGMMGGMGEAPGLRTKATFADPYDQNESFNLPREQAHGVEVGKDTGATEFQFGLTFSMPRKAKAGFRSGEPNRRQLQFERDAAIARQRFAETAYWNPSVVTGKDGKATVKFQAPLSLSEYQFSARGVTGNDTLVGQAIAGLVVRKDFFVDLKVPAVLTQGDKPRFSAQVHHSGVMGPAEVRLTIYSGDRQEVYPKALDLKADGIEEILFEPFEVPGGENVRLTLSARAGEASDELVVEVPIKPWGIQAFASASGTSSDGTTAFVGLPTGRTYEDPEMRIDLSPTLRRLLVELAMGQTYQVYSKDDRSSRVFPCPMPPDTIADHASDLLAATSALTYLREVKTPEAPEAARLADRIRGLAAELVTVQDDDGGWPWVAHRDGRKKVGSDHLTSAQAAHALGEARALGLLPEPAVLDKAVTYLFGEFNQSSNAPEARAAILHALAVLGKASFEQANLLNRVRQGLPDAALAHLALTMTRLDRPSLAVEVLDILASRAKSEPAGPGKKSRKYWEGRDHGPYHRGDVETTALAALAFAKARPGSAEVEAACEWLLAHRAGEGWNPHKAKGSALAALAAFYGKAGSAEDRYRLVVTVNDLEVYRADISGSPEGKVVAVPRKAIKLGDSNRIRFQFEGRGTFGYSVTMTGFARDFGPEQKPDGKPFAIHDRSYLPGDPELDGKALPTGFGVVVNPKTFANKITQVAQGGRARVRIDARKASQPDKPAWDREFLAVEETLPAGASLIEGSVVTSASSYDLADNVLTFYFAPDDALGPIQYDLAGYLPGRYRALPTSIRGAYDPGPVSMGEPASLQVLAPGDPSTDPYRATPDELYARGKALYQGGKLAEAAQPLEELFGGYGLRDEVAKDAARMLLTIHIKDYQPRKVVQDFEILREKGPELVVPFDEVLVVGRAYRDIGEAERAYLIFRAIAEASYIEDAQVGEALRQNGKTLAGIAYLIDLWRESPNTPSIESDFFGLSQLVAGAASRAMTDPALRQELLEAGVTRSELLLQAIRMVQTFLSESPKNPLVDEASLALLGFFLELEDFESVVKLAPRFARLYPKSASLDSFQYGEALGRFSLGQHERAIEVARAIAVATYKDANGVDQPSPNKWQALYILGQIYDARRDPAKAIEYYREVADRFADAAGALKALTRKDLKIPEVSVIRPSPSGVPARDLGTPRPVYPEKLELGYRNIAEADLKVYPVDLMRLYLIRRNLDEIAGIDLAGITPLLEATVKLGDGSDFADRVKTLDLPLTKEGAYLVMARGENLYASGIALVTPLELEVTEEPESGRVRAVVRDARAGSLVPKVQVRVIGTEDYTFVTGQTDLRGVFVAEGVVGQVTVIARKGTGQYAFYRGTSRVGSRPLASPAPAKPGSAETSADSQSLDRNLKDQNTSNQLRQLDRLQNRYRNNQQGVNPF